MCAHNWKFAVKTFEIVGILKEVEVEIKTQLVKEVDMAVKMKMLSDVEDSVEVSALRGTEIVKVW